MLWDENVRSVKYRYHAESEDGVPAPGGPYEYDDDPLIFSQVCPVQTLKAICCYEYQTCKHPEWRESEAYAYVQSLKSVAIHALPGFENAEWEIREKSHATP
jgi:hypothetical protein